MICLTKPAKPYTVIGRNTLGGRTSSGCWHIALKRNSMGTYVLCGHILQNELVDEKIGSRSVTCLLCRKRLLRILDEEDMLVWQLYRFGNSVDEISDEVGIPKKQVWALLERAVFIVKVLEGIDDSLRV